jgi:small conductance mechanosensitive channel
MSWEDLFNINIETPVVAFLLRVLLALLVLIIGHRVAKWSRQAVYRALLRSKITESLIRLSMGLTFYGIIIMAVVLALAVLGFPITAVISVAGIVVIILGIALQESLSSFAATVQFLLFQPFKVGDLVETSGVIGNVKEIQFFNTVIITAQNKTVTIPNNNVRDSNIVNYSEMGVLRADVNVLVGYNEDLRHVKQVLEKMLADDPRVLAEPPATVVVLDFEDNGLRMGIRPFVKLDDYWTIQFNLREQIKQQFDEKGITIPYPQRDVHMVQENNEK